MTHITAATIGTNTEPNELISMITRSLHQMSLERLNAVFNFVQSLDYRAVSPNDLNEEYENNQTKNSLQAEWEPLRHSLRNHPFARMSREEILDKLRQTREEVYDELYGDMYEN